MWATTGPASRGFVSPVFLPNAGPCLECLVRHFQRLSPVPLLHEALARHGELGGAFAAVPFPEEGVTILEQIVRWKLAQLRSSHRATDVSRSVSEGVQNAASTPPLAHAAGDNSFDRLSDAPHPTVFQLHVLELDSFEVSTHRIFIDPTCPECGNARLV
jgi:hypothetical protein